MPGSVREQWEDRAPLIAIALVVTVVVAVGALIVGRGGPTPSATPTATPTTPLPYGSPLRANQLLRGDASTFDHSVGGWTPEQASLDVSSQADHGPGALAVSAPGAPTTTPTVTATPTTTTTTATATSSPPAIANATSSTAMTAWSPEERAAGGDRYVGSAFVESSAGPGVVELELRFIDASGAVTDTETGEPARDSDSKWGEPPIVAAISPKGTVKVQLGISFPPPTSAQRELVDNASLAETPGGHARVVGPLTTRGNQIIDGDGHPIILRGIQRFGLEGGSSNPLPTQAEIQQLSMWGANEVRISLGEQKWLQTSCYYQRNYPEVVDRVVNWVTSRGMVALLNLHFSSAGDCRTPTLIPMADSPGALTFWQEVASRYANNPLVAFDLFNEPYVSQSVWLNGGTYFYDGHGVAAAGMQQLYDDVRNTGAKNLVVISGLHYANQPPTQFVDGDNIVYGAHAYTCPTAPPPHCTPEYAGDPYNPAPILNPWLKLAKTYPLMVSEFGFPDGDSGAYNANVVGYAEEHNLSWSGFAWDGGTDGLFDLVQAHPASDGTTIEPNAAGMPLVAGFALNWPAQP